MTAIRLFLLTLRLQKKCKYSFLLESVEGEEKVARYSFLAKNPELILESKNDNFTIHKIVNNKMTTTSSKIQQSPLTHIRKILKQYKFVELKDLPRFCGGLVGYFSYDVVRFFEQLPENTKDDLNLPDCLLVMAKELIIFDHRNHKIKIVNCVHIDQKSSIAAKKAAYKSALKSIDKLKKELEQPFKAKKK